MIAPVDHATSAYIEQVYPAYGDLRHIAGKLRRWLELREAGASEVLAEHLVLAVARELLRVSREDIEAQSPTPAASRHHDALLQAASYLDRAFPDSGRVAVNVTAAYRQLDRASRLLPGFS
jgi:hypothetical protein